MNQAIQASAPKAAQHIKVLILGSGPAGCAAALYAARANLEPVIIAGNEQGGQLMTTTDVENWPGDPDGAQGPELMERMLRHAQRFGARLISDHIEQVWLDERPLRLRGSLGEYTADALIIATGASAQYLGLDSESEFLGRGVSGCATCDGFFYKGDEVAVVGGGNTAVEEALYLCAIASKVTLIHRRDSLRAEAILVSRLMDQVKAGKARILWNHEVARVLGDQSGVTGLRLRSTQGAGESDILVRGAFIAIGHKPNTGLFEGQLSMRGGYILTSGGSEGFATATSAPGVFAAGDVQDHVYRQAITSAGSGCMAALDALRFLQSQG